MDEPTTIAQTLRYAKEFRHLQDAEGKPGLSSRFHHIGIVVPSEARAAQFMQLFGLAESYRGFVPQYSATCIFAGPKGAPSVEFVISTDEPLARFGGGAGGIHHVAFSVPSLGDAKELLAARSVRLLEQEPVQGAGPFLCNFVPPVYTRGIIVELIEPLDQ